MIGEYLFDGMYTVDDFEEEAFDGLPTGALTAFVSGLIAFCCSITVSDDSGDRWFYMGATNGILFALVCSGNCAFASESLLAMGLFVIIFAGCACAASWLVLGDELAKSIQFKHAEL